MAGLRAVLGLGLLLAAASAQGAWTPDSGECAPGTKALWAAAESIVLPDGSGGEEESMIVYSGNKDFAGGSLRTYVRMSSECEAPVAVGVEMSAGLQADLPGPDGVSNQPPPVCKANPMGPGCFMPNEPIFLPFEEEAAPEWNPFPVLEADWSPLGHDPPPVYGTPHWDVHFYLATQPEIEAIKPGSGPCLGLSPELFAAGNQPIPTSCFPEGAWANIDAIAPLMGNHYIDFASPEAQALQAGGNAIAAWNATWIWGGFNGSITFFELMVKRAYLADQPTVCESIPGLPSQFAGAGYKPSTWCILSTDNGTYVELRDFEWYGAGCANATDFAPGSYMTLLPGTPPLPQECAAVVPAMNMSAPAPAPAPSAAAPAHAAGVLAAAAAALLAVLLL